MFKWKSFLNTKSIIPNTESSISNAKFIILNAQWTFLQSFLAASLSFYVEVIILNTSVYHFKCKIIILTTTLSFLMQSAHVSTNFIIQNTKFIIVLHLHVEQSWNLCGCHLIAPKPIIFQAKNRLISSEESLHFIPKIDLCCWRSPVNPWAPWQRRNLKRRNLY